eukprot:TRINITY_DN1967_c0_g1_i1.p1 TRINITY_DN1967_c0_g1~~TRINITY_DN1967_c0_g1_i1.p1  ORF type:complete len:302 (-),score=67.53 TRINITY_DN1967_c0_g1_i1:206-1111(-)
MAALKRLVVPALAFAYGVQAGELCGEDATVESNPECYKNIEWAKTEGLDTKPEWYTDFPFLNKDSPNNEFQYALVLIRGLHDNKDNCTLPCSLGPAKIEQFSDAVAAAAAKNVADEAGKTAKDLVGQANEAMQSAAASLPSATFGSSGNDSTTAAPSEGWGMWTWLLIAFGLCCLCPCIGLACSAFICYESVAWIFEGGSKPEKKSKKRAITLKAAEPAAPAQPAQAPQPTSSSYIAMAQPVATPVTYAHPVHTVSYAAPAHYAAPVVTSSAPVSTAPVVHYSAPVATVNPAPYIAAPTYA